VRILIEVGDLGAAAASDRPVVGVSTPARIFASVLLPAPFAPTSPTRSPVWIERSILSKMTCAPYDFSSASAVRIGKAGAA